MTFREAMDELKTRYGAGAALSFSAIVRDDGTEAISISAHGGGECAIASTYEGAICDLAAKLAGDSTPPDDAEAEMAA